MTVLFARFVRTELMIMQWIITAADQACEQADNIKTNYRR